MGQHTPENKDRIKEALIDRAEDLFREAWGNPTSKTPEKMRWGNQGSRHAHIAGPDAGLWYDFERAEGGDILSFYAVEFCGLNRATDDFPRVLSEAAKWAGIDISAPFDRAAFNERQRQREAKAVKVAAETATKKTATVAKLQAVVRSVTGSPAAAYLAGRGINATSWPNALSYAPPVRGAGVLAPYFRALVAWATDDQGNVMGGQRILINQDGSKADVDPRKPSFGAIKGYPARFAARSAGGPLCVAEGPETALAIWWATGFETWAVFGDSGFKPAPIPTNRKVIFCPDRDPEGSPAHTAFRKAIAAHRARGVDVWIAEAPEPAGSKDDLADTIARAGAAAVAHAIAKAERWTQVTPLPKKLPFLEGKAALEKAIKDTLQRPEGDTLITAPLGLGKSYATARAVVERIAAYRQAGDTSAAAEVLVPTHKNSVEWEEVLLEAAAEIAPAINVAVVYGPEAKDPATGKPICHRPEERKEQAALLLDGCKGCPFTQECKSYQSKKARADIYIRAHAALSNKPVSATKPPNNKSRNQHAAFAVIDEDHTDGRIVADRTVSVAALCAAPCGDPPKDGTSPLSDRRDALYRIVKANGIGPLRREVIMSNWIERTMRSADTIAADAEAAAKQEYARIIEDPNSPEIEHNRSVMGGVAVWKQLAAFLRTGKDVAHRMRVEICPEKGHCLKLSYVKPLDDAYKAAPKLMLDATADPDLLEIALGERPAVRSIEVATPNLTVRQDWTKSGGKSQLLEHERGSPSANKAARSWQRKIVAYIRREAAKVNSYGLIAYKDLLDLIKDQLPANVKTAHFGALRGLNHMKDCNAAVIIGRPLPRTSALQSMYIAITGDEPPATIKVPVARKVAVEGGYSVVEGKTVTSEDPIMRKIISKIRDKEVLQAVGRVRAIQRLDVPITVTVLSDAVLPDPVEPCAVWDEIKKPDPIQRQLDQGGVAFLAAGHAAQAYPALWSLLTAKQHLAADKVKFLIEDLSMRDHTLTRVVYRAVNGRKDMTALVDAATVDKAREMLLAVMPDARIIEIEPPMPEVPAEYEAEGIVYINQARCIALSWPIEVLGDTGELWLDVASMGKPHLIPPDDMRKIVS